MLKRLNNQIFQYLFEEWQSFIIHPISIKNLELPPW